MYADYTIIQYQEILGFDISSLSGWLLKLYIQRNFHYSCHRD